MISNRKYVIDRVGATGAEALIDMVEQSFEEQPLRWFVSSASRDKIVVESTEYGGELRATGRAHRSHRSGADAVVSLIPTGIGCSIGGYAGDAAPATSLLAAAADLVITNPNAVNASNFIKMDRRVLYTEGSCIDAFSRGEIDLRRSKGNRVGLIIERSAQDHVDHVVNVANAVRAVHGVDVIDYVVTDRPIGTRCVANESGAYVGQVDDPEVLLSAAKELIGRGADAIAVTTNVQNLTSAEYADHFAGKHPNPVGGAEAIVSHLIVRSFGVPAAHAPMMNFKDLDLDQPVVDARAAGEIVSISGLACVLIGLSTAPRMTDGSDWGNDVVSLSDVVAVVAPADALGGVPVLEAIRRNVPVIAVRGNVTIFDVTAENLGFPQVIEVASYAEAAGVILALRNGISLDSISRPMKTLGRVDHTS